MHVKILQDCQMTVIKGFDETTHEPIEDYEALKSGTIIECDSIEDQHDTWDMKIESGFVFGIPKTFVEVIP